MTGLQASPGIAGSELAVEQLRVNSQLAAALDRMSKGQKRATHHPIIRAHDSDDEDSDKFDLAASLFKAAFDFIPTDWFPSACQTTQLVIESNRKSEAPGSSVHCRFCA